MKLDNDACIDLIDRQDWTALIDLVLPHLCRLFARHSTWRRTPDEFLQAARVGIWQAGRRYERREQGWQFLTLAKKMTQSELRGRRLMLPPHVVDLPQRLTLGHIHNARAGAERPPRMSPEAWDWARNSTTQHWDFEEPQVSAADDATTMAEFKELAHRLAGILARVPLRKDAESRRQILCRWLLAGQNQIELADTLGVTKQAAAFLARRVYAAVAADFGLDPTYGGRQAG